jgi:hypothetical protein
MYPEELRDRIWPILYPEREHGEHTLPHRRLRETHGLDCSYWSPLEFSSGSKFSRLVRDAGDPLHGSIEGLTVPGSMSIAALRLFGDSLIAYADESDKSVKRGWGSFRFYPPVLLTFWTAFEAFVRLQTELYLAMALSESRGSDSRR